MRVARRSLFGLRRDFLEKAEDCRTRIFGIEETSKSEKQTLRFAKTRKLR
jgi:hypothetical protein